MNALGTDACTSRALQSSAAHPDFGGALPRRSHGSRGPYCLSWWDQVIDFLAPVIALKDFYSLFHPPMSSLTSCRWPRWAGCWRSGLPQSSLYFWTSLHKFLLLGAEEQKPLISKSPAADTKDKPTAWRKTLWHQFQIQSLTSIVSNGSRQHITCDIRRFLVVLSSPSTRGVIRDQSWLSRISLPALYYFIPKTSWWWLFRGCW